MKLAYLFHYLYYLKIIRLLWNFLIMLVRVKFAYLFKAIHVHKCKCIIDMTYDTAVYIKGVEIFAYQKTSV